MAGNNDERPELNLGMDKSDQNIVSKLYKGAKRPASIAGMARSNIFEFPAFISTSVDYKYAEATCNLLELTYASWLQMSISKSPIIDVSDMTDPFAAWKTDTNNYLECSDLTYTFDACHNVITEDGVTFEFSLVSIPDRIGTIINEAVDYEPMSEFDHYFQEAAGKGGKGTKKRKTKGGIELPDKPDYSDNDMGSQTTNTTDYEYDPNNPGMVQLDGKGNSIVKQTTSTTTPKPYDTERGNEELYNLQLKNQELETKLDQMAANEKRLEANEKRLDDQLKIMKDRADREANSLENDDEYRKYKKEREQLEKEKAEHEKELREIMKQMAANDPDHVFQDPEISAAKLKAYAARDYEADRRNAITKHNKEITVKAPELMDESKVQKLNSLKPLTMNVELRVKNGGSAGSSGFINTIVGVKIYSRLVNAEILPEVAEFPLKEMNRLTRNIRYKAGELKFFKDILFRIKEKKQTAYDSHDPNRKWYRRLYELAHTTGDSAAVGPLTKGKTHLAQRIGGHFFGFIPETSSNRGFIPNATIIVAKEDINNIYAETGIDLLNASKAYSFCMELFLMNFVVIDMDAQTIKVLTPDLHKDFEIHTLASVEKQLSMIDSAAVTSREIFKALKK